MKKYTIYISFLGAILLGCTKEKLKLEDKTTPVIEITKLDENTYIFKNGTPSGGYISNWDFGGIETSTQYIDTVFFGAKGKYKVKLTSNSKGGIATAETEVDVASTNPFYASPKVTKINEHQYQVEDITQQSTATLWNFYNGVKSTKKIDTVYFPLAGSYKIALTSTSPIGTSTNYVDPLIVVAANDPGYALCNDAVITNLTGGCDAVDGKTWLINPAPFKTNVGAADDLTSSYYNFPDGLGGPTWTQGALNNEYTFKLKNFEYVPKNTNVSVHFAYANKFFGKNQAEYADINLSDPNHKPANWVLNKDASNKGTGYGFTITDGSYIGFFEQRYKYYIVRITADTMYMAHRYNDDPEADPTKDNNARYFTFVAKK